MPRASCTRRPGDTASRCRGRGTYSPDASRSTSPPSPGEEPRAPGRVWFASRALRDHYAAASMAYAVQALTHYQTYPERPPGADLPPKKVCNLDPMAPRSRQKRQLPEGPQ